MTEAGYEETPNRYSDMGTKDSTTDIAYWDKEIKRIEELLDKPITFPERKESLTIKALIANSTIDSKAVSEVVVIEEDVEKTSEMACREETSILQRKIS